MGRRFWRAYAWFFGVLVGVSGVVVAAVEGSTFAMVLAGAFAWYAILRMEAEL